MANTSVGLANCDRIEEEEDFLPESVDQTDHSKLSPSPAMVRATLPISIGCMDSPPLTPPNTLKIPLRSSEPIPIRFYIYIFLFMNASSLLFGT